MGHTIMSQRRVHQIILSELNDFSRSLSGEDKKIFEDLLNSSLKHIGSISFTSSYQVWAIVLLSILLEQEKKIRAVNSF